MKGFLLWKTNVNASWPSFLPRLNSLFSLPPPSHRRKRNGDSGHLVTLWHSFLLRLRTIHTLPAPAWGSSHRKQFSTNFFNMSPSHGLEFFINCSSVSSFHGVQSFRSRLFQCGSSMGSWQQTCCSVGFSLQRHRSCKEPALVWACHRVTASFGDPLLQCGVLHRLQVDVCSSVNRYGHMSGTAASPRAALESLLWCLEQLLLLLHQPWCLQSCLSHIVSLLSLVVVNYIIPEMPPS